MGNSISYPGCLHYLRAICQTSGSDRSISPQNALVILSRYLRSSFSSLSSMNFLIYSSSSSFCSGIRHFTWKRFDACSFMNIVSALSHGDKHSVCFYWRTVDGSVIIHNITSFLIFYISRIIELMAFIFELQAWAYSSEVSMID